jgi:hypothetical protein
MIGVNNKIFRRVITDPIGPFGRFQDLFDYPQAYHSQDGVTYSRLCPIRFQRPACRQARKLGVASATLKLTHARYDSD